MHGAILLRTGRTTSQTRPGGACGWLDVWPPALAECRQWLSCSPSFSGRLMPARAHRRQRGFSVRRALGAGRGALLRQLLAESLILVTAGGALAWGFAVMATRLLGGWAQIESNLSPDRTVLLFTLGVLAVTALLLALAPLRVALAGGAQLALKTSAAAANTDTGKSRAGRVIVALQMALCLVLL